MQMSPGCVTDQRVSGKKTSATLCLRLSNEQEREDAAERAGYVITLRGVWTGSSWKQND